MTDAERCSDRQMLQAYKTAIIREEIDKMNYSKMNDQMPEACSAKTLKPVSDRDRLLQHLRNTVASLEGTVQESEKLGRYIKREEGVAQRGGSDKQCMAPVWDEIDCMIYQIDDLVCIIRERLMQAEL